MKFLPVVDTGLLQNQCVSASATQTLSYDQGCNLPVTVCVTYCECECLCHSVSTIAATKATPNKT